MHACVKHELGKKRTTFERLHREVAPRTIRSEHELDEMLREVKTVLNDMGEAAKPVFEGSWWKVKSSTHSPTSLTLIFA